MIPVTVARTGRLRLSRLIALTLLALGVVFVPALAQAQINAQTAQSLSLTAADLGPEWSRVGTSTQKALEIEIFESAYQSAGGRDAVIDVGIASSPQLAEAIIDYYRAIQERGGFRIISVQSQGFGDGRAFKAEATSGSSKLVTYQFRVKNIYALVLVAGASAQDASLQADALKFARAQERKLFAAFEPVVVATPTPAPAAPTAVPTAAPVPTAVPVAGPRGCAPGENPRFVFGFAALKERLGPIMGNPTTCEYPDPNGSGDSLQNTDRGLSFYRKSTNTPTFTTGFEHWAQTAQGLVYWTGDSIDPTADAQPWVS